MPKVMISAKTSEILHSPKSQLTQKGRMEPKSQHSYDNKRKDRDGERERRAALKEARSRRDLFKRVYQILLRAVKFVRSRDFSSFSLKQIRKASCQHVRGAHIYRGPASSPGHILYFRAPLSSRGRSVCMCVYLSYVYAGSRRRPHRAAAGVHRVARTCARLTSG